MSGLTRAQLNQVEQIVAFVSGVLALGFVAAAMRRMLELSSGKSSMEEYVEEEEAYTKDLRARLQAIRRGMIL